MSDTTSRWASGFCREWEDATDIICSWRRLFAHRYRKVTKKLNYYNNLGHIKLVPEKGVGSLAGL